MQLNVNKNFIECGRVHEVGQLVSHPQTGQQMIHNSRIYIESVEVVGGNTFLGIRAIKNLHMNEDNTEVVSYDLFDTVQYHNINLYIMVQKCGTNNKFEKELKEYRDLKQRKQEEAENEPVSRPGSGFDNTGGNDAGRNEN